MLSHSIILPSKPRVVHEDDVKGIYEIDGLYPGYGHTLGNSLRRIILSSLPGAAVTMVKIAGVPHEFSTISGVKEDVIAILLNVKMIRFKMVGDGPLVLRLKASGVGEVKASDIELPGQIEVVNGDQTIATITDKNVSLDVELTVEKGLGYVSKESHQKDKLDIGMIALDAAFTPIRRAMYEVDRMRVGDRTDFNRLRLIIETNGIVSPREALEQSIALMVEQLQAIIGFEAKMDAKVEVVSTDSSRGAPSPAEKEAEDDVLKTRVEDLDLSSRTLNALTGASIRTVGGLARKREVDLLEVAGLGDKGISEIKRALSNFGLTLRQ